jgi:hypothetical protein
MKELDGFFLQNYHQSSVSLLAFFDLPFEFQLGVWMVFFQANAIDLDIQSMQLADIESSVDDCLQMLENSIGHYS